MLTPPSPPGVQAVGGSSPAADKISEESHVTPLLETDAYNLVFRTSQVSMKTVKHDNCGGHCHVSRPQRSSD